MSTYNRNMARNTQFNIQEEKALFDQFSRYISYKDHVIKNRESISTKPIQ